MSIAHETVFQCSVACDAGEFAGRVRARTPQAAGDEFRAVLERAGVRLLGTVRVRGLDGLVARQVHVVP